MRHSILGLLCVPALLVFISGCGGDEEVTKDEPLTVEEYARRVASLQEDSRKAFNEASTEIVQPGSDPMAPGSLESFSKYYELAIQEGDRFFQAMGALTPPLPVTSAHEAFVAAWSPYRAYLEQSKERWASATSYGDAAEESMVEGEAVARNPFEDACISLEDAVREQGKAVTFDCDVDWFFGGGEVVGGGGCIGLPVEGSQSEQSECPEESPSVALRGRTRIAEMPPLPSGLVPVSYYYETVKQPVDAGELGIGLPLLKPVSDPSSIALYSYSNGNWQRIGEVVIRDVGTMTAEATFESTYPDNYAVLQTTR